MDRRRQNNVVRGNFRLKHSPKWTSPSDFAPELETHRATRSRRSGRTGPTRWGRYVPLWLLAVLGGLAYGSGAFTRDAIASFFSIDRPDHVRVYYRRCADARAAGAAPIRRGEPGYREALDRDLDGVACEPYFGN